MIGDPVVMGSIYQIARARIPLGRQAVHTQLVHVLTLARMREQHADAPCGAINRCNMPVVGISLDQQLGIA